VTYIATGEITTLKHEVGNDTVELGAFVAANLVASAEGTEILSGLRDYIVVQGKIDTTSLL
jgi:hypothetical protein